LIKVSYSRVSSYLNCPQRHHFKYIQNLRVKKPARPLFFGGDFHKLLQYRHNRVALATVKDEILETFRNMPVAFQNELGDDYIDDLFTVFEDYQRYWKGEQKPIKLEKEFLIQIGKYRGEPVYFHGIIDEIYEDNVMGEHKTFSSMPNMSSLALNSQVCLYSKANQLETGEYFTKVLWDYTRSSPAKYPIWLDKSKRFSEAQNSNITPYSWERACKERGIEDESILSIGNKYAPNLSNFFFRHTIEIVPNMAETVWESFKYVTKDLIKRGGSNTTKNIGRHCDWCDYRAICFAQYTGADVDYVIKTDYKYKEE
jgi:CRISPR/Cas system-associated exonuclease Cas4 (RecB family)